MFQKKTKHLNMEKCTKTIYNTLFHNNKLQCPFCSNVNIVKNGKNKNKQRYLCKDCKKSFINETNTPIYNSKKNINLWIRFLECLYKQYSLREISKKVNISTSTAFYWRHKILDAIRENEKIKFLSGFIKCRAILFNESFKGNHSKSKFKMPRPAYKSYLTPFEFLKRKKVCVLLADDTKNKLLSPIGRTSGLIPEYNLIKFFNNNTNEVTELISNNINLRRYKKLNNVFSLVNFFELDANEQNKYNFNDINFISMDVYNFFCPYRGVATKYLSNYLALFKFINMNKIKSCPLFYRVSMPLFIKNYKERLPLIA